MPDWVDLPLLSGSVQQRADSAGNILGSSALDDAANVIDPRISDFIQSGVFNGTFARGPDSPSENIEDVNQLPDWTGPAPASGAVANASWVANVESPSGYGLQFAMAAGAAADDTYVEQTVPAMGLMFYGPLTSFFAEARPISGATGFLAYINVQYLDAAGGLLGSAIESTSGLDASLTYNSSVFVRPDSFGNYSAPTYARIRIGIRRDTAAAGDTFTAVFVAVRGNRGATYGDIQAATTTGLQITRDSFTATDGARIDLARRDQRNGGVIPVAVDDKIGELRGIGSTQTQWLPAASIQFHLDTTGGAADMPGRISLWTTPDGTSTLVERMRIDNAGRAGIGVTPASTGGILQLSSGITFPATQVASADANTLDDYEEGTWTPVLTFATPGDLAVVYSVQAGRYVKIGRMVWASFYCLTTTWTHATASGNIQITGLPFTSQNENPLGSGAVAHGGWTRAGYGATVAMVTNNTTLLTMYVVGSGGTAGATLSTTHCPSGTQQRVQGHVIYFATA